MGNFNTDNPYVKLSLQYFEEALIKKGIYFNGTVLCDYREKTELNISKEYCLEFIREVRNILREQNSGLNLSCNVKDLNDITQKSKIYFTCIPNLETFFIYSDESIRNLSLSVQYCSESI